MNTIKVREDDYRDFENAAAEVDQIEALLDGYGLAGPARPLAQRVFDLMREADDMWDAAFAAGRLAEEKAWLGAKRAVAASCGLLDPDDSDPCLADFGDEIKRLRSDLANALRLLETAIDIVEAACPGESVWIDEARLTVYAEETDND